MNNIIKLCKETQVLWNLYEEKSLLLETAIWKILPNTLSDLIDSIIINTDYDNTIFIDIECSKRYHNEMSEFLDKVFYDNWTNMQEGDYDNQYWIYVNDKFYKQMEAIS